LQLGWATSKRGYVLVAASAENASTLYAGELEIRLGEGLVLATGRALTLSVREFELLAAMARRAGAIVSRNELYAEVWGGDLRVGDRSVDVYVSKLRGKLETAMPDRRFIHTHPGFGYRFQPQPARDGGVGGSALALDGANGANSADESRGETRGETDRLSRNVYIGTGGK
jgi:DNA-binding winged helix-turn-helix (wHTH) protein